MSWRDHAEKVSDWRATAEPVTDLPDGTNPGSPLAKALASQSGDTLTIETPTGTWTGNRQGNPIAEPQPFNAMGPEDPPEVRFRNRQQLLSLLSGGAHGLAPIANGLKSVVTGPGESIVERYRRGRDAAKQTIDTATEESSPKVAGIPVLPMIGGVVTSGPLGETAPLRIAVMGLTSAAQGAAESPGDLTKGEFAQVGADALESGARGAAFAGLFEGASALPRLGANAAKGRAAVERAAGVDQELEKAAALKRSQQSTVAQIGQQQKKTIDNLDEIVANARGLYSSEEVKAAADAIASTEGRALRSRAASNVLERYSDLLPRETSAREELAALSAQATPEAAAGRFADRESSAFQDQAVKTAKSAAPRVATGLAADLFGSTGAAVGLTSPGTQQMMRNASKNFALRARALDSLGTGAEALGDTVSTMGRLNQFAPTLKTQPTEESPSVPNQPPVAQQQNAMDQLTQYLGRPMKDKQEAADQHFLLGTSDPRYQKKNEEN